MLYNKEIIEERKKLLSDIHYKIQNINNERQSILAEIDKLKNDTELSLEEIDKNKTDEIIKIENKTNTDLDKVINKIKSETKNNKETLIKTQEDYKIIYDELEETFGHLQDNYDRGNKFDTPNNLTEAITKLNELYGQVNNKKYEKEKRSAGITKITSLIQDKIIELKGHLQTRQKLALIIAFIMVIYKIAKGFISKGPKTQIIYLLILIIIILTVTTLKRIYKTKSVYGNVERIYEIYNLIDYIEKKCKLEQLSVDIQEREKIEKAENIAQSIKNKSLKIANEKFDKEKWIITEEYTYKLSTFELKGVMGLPKLAEFNEFNEFDELININTLENDKSISLLANVVIGENKIGLYYTLNNVIINSSNCDKAENIMQNLITELITKSDKGKINIKMADPIGLGSKFKEILKLKNIGNQLDTKINITDDEISQMLDLSIKKISNRIQNMYKDNYTNIQEYNSNNEVKLDYEFIFIQDFNSIQEVKINQKIKTIIKQGKDVGVILVISGYNISEIIPEKTDVDIIDINEDGIMKLARYDNETVDYVIQ